MDILNDPDLDLETRLNGQTGRIGWHELQRYFAKGVIREVDAGLDLIDVGRAIIDNDTDQVQQWLAADALTVPSDEKAQQWYKEQEELWALVVAPWVLVQVITE